MAGQAQLWAQEPRKVTLLDEVEGVANRYDATFIYRKVGENFEYKLQFPLGKDISGTMTKARDELLDTLKKRQLAANLEIKEPEGVLILTELPGQPLGIVTPAQLESQSLRTGLEEVRRSTATAPSEVQASTAAVVNDAEKVSAETEKGKKADPTKLSKLLRKARASVVDWWEFVSGKEAKEAAKELDTTMKLMMEAQAKQSVMIKILVEEKKALATETALAKAEKANAQAQAEDLQKQYATQQEHLKMMIGKKLTPNAAKSLLRDIEKGWSRMSETEQGVWNEVMDILKERAAKVPPGKVPAKEVPAPTLKPHELGQLGTATAEKVLGFGWLKGKLGEVYKAGKAGEVVLTLSAAEEGRLKKALVLTEKIDEKAGYTFELPLVSIKKFNAGANVPLGVSVKLSEKETYIVRIEALR